MTRQQLAMHVSLVAAPIYAQMHPTTANNVLEHAKRTEAIAMAMALWATAVQETKLETRSR